MTWAYSGGGLRRPISDEIETLKIPPRPEQASLCWPYLSFLTLVLFHKWHWQGGSWGGAPGSEYQQLWLTGDPLARRSKHVNFPLALNMRPCAASTWAFVQLWSCFASDIGREGWGGMAPGWEFQQLWLTEALQGREWRNPAWEVIIAHY